MSVEKLVLIASRVALASGLAWTALNSGNVAIAQEPSSTVIQGEPTPEQLATEVDGLRWEVDTAQADAEEARNEADSLRWQLEETQQDVDSLRWQLSDVRTTAESAEGKAGEAMAYVTILNLTLVGSTMAATIYMQKKRKAQEQATADQPQDPEE